MSSFTSADSGLASTGILYQQESKEELQVQEEPGNILTFYRMGH